MACAIVLQEGRRRSFAFLHLPGKGPICLCLNSGYRWEPFRVAGFSRCARVVPYFSNFAIFLYFNFKGEFLVKTQKLTDLFGLFLPLKFQTDQSALEFLF